MIISEKNLSLLADDVNRNILHHIPDIDRFLMAQVSLYAATGFLWSAEYIANQNEDYVCSGSRVISEDDKIKLFDNEDLFVGDAISVRHGSAHSLLDNLTGLVSKALVYIRAAAIDRYLHCPAFSPDEFDLLESPDEPFYITVARMLSDRTLADNPSELMSRLPFTYERRSIAEISSENRFIVRSALRNMSAGSGTKFIELPLLDLTKFIEVESYAENSLVRLYS